MDTVSVDLPLHTAKHALDLLDLEIFDVERQTPFSDQHAAMIERHLAHTIAVRDAFAAALT